MEQRFVLVQDNRTPWNIQSCILPRAPKLNCNLLTKISRTHYT